MNMNEYIEKAQEKAGSQIKLAKTLEISDRYIRLVREGKRGFPDDICIQIADYIGVDRLEVIAASNLVTEKDNKKRKIFESCFSRAASIIIATSVISIMTLAPPKPANAMNLTDQLTQIYIISNCRRKKFRRKSDLFSKLFYNFLTFFPRGGSLSY